MASVPCHAARLASPPRAVTSSSRSRAMAGSPAASSVRSVVGSGGEPVAAQAAATSSTRSPSRTPRRGAGSEVDEKVRRRMRRSYGRAGVAVDQSARIAWAMRSSNRSPCGGPTSCRPTGSAPSAASSGTEIAGHVVTVTTQHDACQL